MVVPRRAARVVRWGQWVLVCAWAWDALALDAWQVWPAGVAQHWGDVQARPRRAHERVAQLARAWAAVQE